MSYFNVTVNGSYPNNDTYSASPNPSYIDPNLGPLYFKSYLRYQKRPINEIIHYLDPLYYSIVNYNYSTFVDNHKSTILPQNNCYDTLDFTNSSNITLNISTLRQTYKTPSEFYVFYVDTSVDTLLDSSQFGYILYPYKLFLKPISVTRSGGNWVLNTTSNIIATSYQTFNSNTVEQDAANYHKNYLNTTPTLLGVSSLVGYALSYDLYSARTVIDKNILTFNSTNQKAQSPNNILENNSKINLDSTLVCYDVIDGSGNTVVQVPYDVYRDAPYQTFSTSYILRYDPVNSNQLFQLAQTPNAGGDYLGSTTNCFLSAIVGNNTSYFGYLNKNNSGFSGVVGSSISVSYIADSNTIKYTNEPVKNTLNSFKIGSNFYNLQTPILATTVSTSIISWTTKYPPHYYSYKTTLSSSSLSYLDSCSLNFYLRSDIYDTGVTYVSLSSKIVSDFNIINYDIPSNSYGTEYIKYNAIGVDPLVLPDLVCTYSKNNPSLSGNYSLSNPTWIPVKNGCDLTIDYPSAKYGQNQFTLRASLSTVAGIIDAFQATHITLAQNLYSLNTIPDLIVETNFEDSSIIVADTTLNTSEISWPGIDLRSNDTTVSYGTWSYTPQNLNLSLYTVDLSGNFIRYISPNERIVFGDFINYPDRIDGWIVGLSGYGPTTVSLTVSSQKYSITGGVTSNPNLFNYFSENKFIITPAVDLNNLEETRTIILKVDVPFKGQLLDIPDNTPMYYTWTYDGIEDPNSQPISVFDINDNPYEYSTNASSNTLKAILVEVTPPKVNINPKLHEVKINVFSDILYPTISGSYTFYVDDFPSSDVFNSDFSIFYKNFSNVQIANTRNGINTITRPYYTNADLKFNFVPNTDIIPQISYTSLNWYLNINDSGNSLQSKNNDNSFTFDFSFNHNFKNKITLELFNAYAPGWFLPHNIRQEAYVYCVDPSEFYKPLQFIKYPQYFWINNTITESTSSNYTLSLYPSAYGNTKSGTLGFYLSTNKDYFTDYYYTSLDGLNDIDVNSYNSLVDLNYDESLINNVISLQLAAYNNTTYPLINGYLYQIPENGNLVTKSFNITANSLPFNSTNSNNFLKDIIILPYNDLFLNFSVKDTILNLDQQKVITITQNIKQNGGPAIPVGGTITYHLSSEYWVADSTVNAINGTYNIFALNIGDPYVPLYSGDLGTENFYLYATTNILQQIPDKGLWNTIEI